jgi:hypothetical protein
VATDKQIDDMLERCSKDAVLSALAWQLLQNYRIRGLTIAGMHLPSAETERWLHGSKEKLRTDLCDLLEPMLAPDSAEKTATSSASGLYTPKQES